MNSSYVRESRERAFTSGEKKMATISSTYLLLSVCAFMLAPSCLGYSLGEEVKTALRTGCPTCRSLWVRIRGDLCPRFGLDTEVLLPFPRPTGYTGADAYKIALQIENAHTGWQSLVERQRSEVPMISIFLIYDGGNLLSAVAKVENMPHQYDESVRNHFWDVEGWPKRILVRYQWYHEEEKSRIEVETGLLGSDFVLMGGIVHQFLERILRRFVMASGGNPFVERTHLCRFVNENYCGGNTLVEERGLWRFVEDHRELESESVDPNQPYTCHPDSWNRNLKCTLFFVEELTSAGLWRFVEDHHHKPPPPPESVSDIVAPKILRVLESVSVTELEDPKRPHSLADIVFLLSNFQAKKSHSEL